DAEKDDDEDISKESAIDDQERPENSTQDVNIARPSINTASTNVNTDSLNTNIVSPPVTTAPLEATHANFFDHSLDHMIGDVQSSVQTRRMTKTINEQGFISAIYEGKTHEDLHTCLFACFVSQEEPKKVIQALKDPSWIEAMQKELLQFKNKKDERGNVIRNKARLVAQGYTQEEGINYDEVFAPIARIEAVRLFLAYASFKDFVVYQMDVKSVFLSNDGIFISQDKYVDEILKKFGFSIVKTSSTPMKTSKPLLKDAEAEDVDVHLYRSMISSLMYLPSSRPDIMFDVCACARFQVTPKVSYLHAVKRIFRYLKGQPKLGLWYPKDSPFDLEAYSDSDYAGASLDRKSTTGADYAQMMLEMEWRLYDGTVKRFSVAQVWECIRPRADKDRVSIWDYSNVLGSTCPLCEATPDSHEHLFFICPFRFGVAQDYSCCYCQVSCCAQRIYFEESNWRLFRVERSIDQVVACISSSVRMKLLSCAFKSTTKGVLYARLWDLPNSIFR
ncbi:ribonuclease H-like domain, reverse transcriptase, RNA-dependent DNA polymerase, partial [Tanacetum coccineum]